MRVVCVAGARPNFVKVEPVIRALQTRGIEAILVDTGQHYDPLMKDAFFSDLDLRPPDRSLNAGSGTHAEQTAAIMVRFEPVVAQIRPDWIVVVGDVNSTIAAALVGAKAGVPIAHVEAGLRSGDWSMPEEVNRVATDRLSTLLFAPSADAVSNLQEEGRGGEDVHLVGNVMVDTLLANVGRARGRPVLSELGLKPGEFVLVTLHRPDTVDRPHVLERLLGALATLSTEIPVIFPMHPRTAPQVPARFRTPEFQLLPPLGYLDFLALEASARVVITDSGGIQEETTALGTACLTARHNTERPITISEGTNELVGTDPDRLLAAARRVITDGVAPRSPALWDGKAAHRVADVIAAAAPRPPEIQGSGSARR